MSRFKRALSLLLCLVMLIGTVSAAASVVSAEDATATAGVSSVKSYQALDDAHNTFVYLATEVYEPDADGNYELTDYYVDAGMKLKVRVFLKTDLYIGTGKIGFLHDNRFFDIQNGTGAYDKLVNVSGNTGNTDLAAAGFYGNASGGMLSDESAYKNNRLTYKTKVVDADYSIALADIAQQNLSYKRNTDSTLCYEAKSDAYAYEYYVTVRKGLADGTRGLMWADPYTYSFAKSLDSTLGTGTGPFDVRTSTESTTAATSCKTLLAAKYTLDNFLVDDAYHIFTAGSATKKTISFKVPVYAADGSVSEYKDYTYEAGADYEAFEGSVSDYANAEVDFPAVDPAIDGYNFTGWGLATLDADGNITGVGSAVTSIKVGASDETYVALFTQNPTYDVKYVYGDADTAYGATEKYEENEAYTIRADYPAVEGYKFLGWSTVKGDKEAIVTGSQTMAKEAVTLYAVYKLDQFKVSFYSNGSKSKFETNGSQVYTHTADFGSTVTAEDIADKPVREGYVFNGWATDKDAESGITTGELCVVPANNATAFYATWKPEVFTVKVYYSKEAYQKDTDGTKADETITVEAGQAFKIANPYTLPEGHRFVQWSIAETGESFSKNMSEASVTNYNKGSVSIYPEITKYAYSVTYKVWDYANNKWVDLGEKSYTDKATYTIEDFNSVRATIDPAALGLPGAELAHPYAAVKNDGVTPDNGMVSTYAGVSFADADYAGTSDIAYGKTTYEMVDGNRKAATIVDLSEEAVADDAVFYIYTKVKFNIENTTAKFDENGKWTDEKTTTTTIYLPNSDEYHKTEFTRLIDKADLVSPDEDYKFINFTDAEGNEIVPEAETDATYTLKISAKDGSNIVINNNFGPKTYVFYFQPEGITNVIMTAESYKIGDTFDPEKAKFVYVDSGEEAVLPKLGVAAEDQATPITSKEGYKLVGWEFQRIAGENIKFPVEITKEFLKSTVYGDAEVIRISAIWEAMPYTANFYYTDATGKEVLLTSMSVKVGTLLSNFAPLDEETLATLNAAAGEGKVFARWAAKDGGADTSMTVGGRDYIAVYENILFNVYVDYNNGKNVDENGNLVLKRAGNIAYGKDLEYGDSDYQAAGFVIRTETFARTNANLPSETAVTTGWKVFYVENPDDLYNREKWVEGYNSKNDGTNAYSIVIYQAQWMDYSDFIIRINDTEGKLYLGLTKDFKVLYWNNDKASDKDNAVMNPIENNIILFFTISFENGLSLTPFSVNASLFTIDGIIGLFQALGNAISGLLGDWLGDIELPSFDIGGIGGGEGEGDAGEGEGGGIFDFDFNISLPC